MRPYVLATTLWLVPLVTTAQAESTGTAALDEWLQANRDIGLEASYDSVREDGDSLTATGVTFTYSTEFIIDETSETKEKAENSEGKAEQEKVLKFTFEWTSPELKAENFIADDKGFSVDLFTLSNDTRFSVTLDNGEQPFTLTGQVEGYQLTEAFWPQYPEIAEDPEHPVSRWLPILKLYTESAVAESRIDRIFMASKELVDPAGNGAFAIDYEIRDLLMKDMKDGFISEYSTGRIIETVTGKDKDGKPLDFTIQASEISVDGYDFKALLTLFDPELADTPNGSNPILALERGEALNYQIKASEANVTIDRIVYNNIGVRTPAASLIPFFDQLALGKEPDPKEFGLALFEVYRAMSIGEFSIEGIAIDVKKSEPSDSGEPSGLVKAAIGKILLADISADGLGEFSFSGVDAIIEDEGQFHLGKFAVGNIEFAPYGPIRKMIDIMAAGKEPDPLEAARAFTPRSFTTLLEDVFVQIPKQGSIKVAATSLDMETTIPPVPTSVEFALDQFEIPVSMLNDKQSEALFRAAGIDTFKLTEAVTIKWDEKTEDLTIDDLVVDVGQIGQIRATAHLGGLPRKVFEDPEQFQIAIATLTVKSLDLELVNSGGVETALALQSKQAGISEQQLSGALLQQLKGLLAFVGNEGFEAMVMNAAQEFFADPKTLRLKISPDHPVPVAQIIGGAAAAPQTLPDMLSVSIEANQ